MPGLVHVVSHFPTASPLYSAGVAFFSLLATTPGREGTIRLEVLMGNFWCLSCHLGDTWTLVLSSWDESCTGCTRPGSPQPRQGADCESEGSGYKASGVPSPSGYTASGVPSPFLGKPPHPGPGIC